MPRTLSPKAVEATQALESGEVWIVLLTIEHADLAETIYLVNNTENVIVQQGVDPDIEYIAYPFDLTLGDDTGEKLMTVKLNFDNVDRTLIETIRSISDSPDINLKLVLASQPEEIEIEISNLKLRQIPFDAYTIQAVLYSDDILNQRYPKDNITIAAGYHGMFR